MFRVTKGDTARRHSFTWVLQVLDVSDVRVVDLKTGFKLGRCRLQRSFYAGACSTTRP